MKTFLQITLVLMIFSVRANAQTTIVLKPNAANGKDARIWDLNPTTNYGTEADFIAAAWTWGGSNGLLRSLIQFDLSSIPTNATVVSASISLFYNTTSSSAGQAGANATFLQRVTSSWDENLVTWSNQPTATSVNQISLAQSGTANQSYLNIDATQIVQDMINNPTTSFGFLMKLQNEIQMESMKFCSSDFATDSTKFPELTITYIPSNHSCFTLQPGASDGMDARIWDLNPTTNYGTEEDFIAAAWTWGGSNGLLRSLLQFDLSSIPSNATIDTAELSLYWNTTSSSAGQAGANASWLQRVTSTWDENAVTWNNQPTTTTVNEVALATSTSGTQNYPDIDVKNLVIDMVNNPTTSFGFLLKLQNEVQMESMKFCSSDFPTAAMRPKLKICYSIPDAVIELNSQTAAYNIFPNPFTNEINISFPETTNTQIELYDVLGRMISSNTISDKNYFSMNTSNLTTGIYLIRIVSREKIFFRKILKEE